MGIPVFRFRLTHQTPENGPVQFSNNSFLVSLSGWTQLVPSGFSAIAFSWASGGLARAAGSAANTTALGQTNPFDSLNGWHPGDYIIDIVASNRSTGGSAPLTQQLQIGSSNASSGIDNAVSFTGSATWDVNAGFITRRISFTLTTYQKYLWFYFLKQGSNTGYNVDFYVDSITIVSAPIVKFISEPDGWKDSKLILERHEDYHSLVEYYEGGFLFYGNNGIDDGGIDFIKNVEQTYGFDATIKLLAEVTFDESVYETVFDGTLDLSQLQEVKYNKMDVPIIRDSLWIRFINRRDNPENLRSTTSVDGNTISQTDIVDVNLTAQIIRQKYLGKQEQDASTSYTIANNQYGLIDFIQEDFNEINDKYVVPRVDNSTIEQYLFAVEFGGLYNFDIRIVTTTATILGSATDSNLHVKLQINNTVVTLSKTNEGTVAIDGRTVHTYTGLQTLNKGDIIRLYFHNQTGGAYSFAWPAYILRDSHLQITADTIFPSSNGQAFLLHDAFAGIIERITNRSAFYSELLGATFTNSRSYSSDGCHSGNIILKGLHLRNYTVDQKPLFTSFTDLWEGANPIFALSLGYETINGEQVIRIEGIEEWYDANHISVYISNVNEIIREYDNDRIFKKIEIGYNKWQSEDASGIDDPQTKHTYTTRFEKTGKDFRQYSKFIGAALAIENTRRKSIKQTEDYKFDDDTFIIAINKDDVSPDRFNPELTEKFDSVSNVIRSETRYNLIHTPLRMLLRWSKYLNGCLQKYLTSSYRFVSGEGNYDMVSDYNCTLGNQCIAKICTSLSEKQDISLSTYGSTLGYLHLPDYFTITIDLSWEDYKRIRDNRKYSIAVSQTEANYYQFFIKKLEYELCHAKAKIIMWPIVQFGLNVLESVQPSPPGGWNFANTSDTDNPCQSVFTEYTFQTTLQGWTSEGSQVTPDALAALNSWSNVPDTSFAETPPFVMSWDWAVGSTPQVNFGTTSHALNTQSDFYYIPYAFIAGLTYTFGYDFVGVTSPLGFSPIDATYKIKIMDASKNVLAEKAVAYVVASGHSTGTYVFTAIDGMVGIAIQVFVAPAGSQHSYTIQSFTNLTAAFDLPSWAWNSHLSGSAKVTTLYEDYGVKNLILSPASLPHQDCRIVIRYALAVNNGNNSLTFRIKDSGGNIIYTNTFANDVVSTSEQEVEIDINSTTVQTNANKFEIVVSSSDFDAGDEIYITDFLILSCIDTGTYEPEYQAILDYATSQGYTLPSLSQRDIQNQFLLDLKDLGVWSDLDILYVFATDGDSNFACINWINPGTFQASAVGSPTFTTNKGFTGGSFAGKYLNTGWIPSVNGSLFTLNDGSAFAYSDVDVIAATKFLFGTDNGIVAGSVDARTQLVPHGTFNNHIHAINSRITDSVGSSVSAKGFFHTRRSASNDLRLYKNGSQVGSTQTAAPTSDLSDYPIFLLSNNSQGVEGGNGEFQIGIFGIGASSAGKESTLYTAWNNYFTSL